MDCFLLILSLFGGLVLLFGLGNLIAHLLKLDKFDVDMQKHKNEDMQKHKNEDTQKSTMKMIKITTIK